MACPKIEARPTQARGNQRYPSEIHVPGLESKRGALMDHARQQQCDLGNGAHASIEKKPRPPASSGRAESSAAAANFRYDEDAQADEARCIHDDARRSDHPVHYARCNHFPVHPGHCPQDHSRHGHIELKEHGGHRGPKQQVKDAQPRRLEVVVGRQGFGRVGEIEVAHDALLPLASEPRGLSPRLPRAVKWAVSPAGVRPCRRHETAGINPAARSPGNRRDKPGGSLDHSGAAGSTWNRLRQSSVSGSPFPPDAAGGRGRIKKAGRYAALSHPQSPS